MPVEAPRATRLPNPAQVRNVDYTGERPENIAVQPERTVFIGLDMTRSNSVIGYADGKNPRSSPTPRTDDELETVKQETRNNNSLIRQWTQSQSEADEERTDNPPIDPRTGTVQPERSS